MSTQAYCTSPERYNASYGNWEPAEYDEYLVCDYCCGLDDEEPDLNAEMYSIPWLSDFHVCETHIADFLDDEGNDYDYECPVCHLQTTKETFADHVLNNHLTLEGV